MKVLVGDDKLEVVQLGTVNLEIFARALFPRNFAYAKFREVLKSLCLSLIYVIHGLVAIF